MSARARAWWMSNLAVTLLLAGCAGPGEPSPTASPTESKAPASAELPPEPRILFEWYPSGSDRKTVNVSDSTASSPAVPIVPADGNNNVHASWSRDGSEFAWEVLTDSDESTVWTAKADGSEPAQEVECEAAPCVEMSYPAFSPDGRTLLVTRYDKEDNGDWGPSHLVTVERATGKQTILASTADGTTAFYSTSWSPDGSMVTAQLESYPDATESEISGSVVVVTDTDPETTTAPIPLTDPALFAGYPRWHPTEDRILFASWDLNAFQGEEASQLYTVNSGGADLQQITHVAADSAERPGNGTWTPDGARIIAGVGVVSSGRVVDVKISWVDPATGDITTTDRSGAAPSLQPSP